MADQKQTKAQANKDARAQNAAAQDALEADRAAHEDAVAPAAVPPQGPAVVEAIARGELAPPPAPAASAPSPAPQTSAPGTVGQVDPNTGQLITEDDGPHPVSDVAPPPAVGL